MILPNQVGTSDEELTTTPLTPPSRRLQPGTPTRQTASAVVAALSTVLTAFLLPGRRAVLHGDGLGGGLVGQVLDAGQRGRVDARLKLALHQHRVPDVDHEADADESKTMLTATMLRICPLSSEAPEALATTAFRRR